jgi:hypothetical protein
MITDAVQNDQSGRLHRIMQLKAEPRRARVVLIARREIQLGVKFSSDVVLAGSLAAAALGLDAIGAARSQEDDQPDEQ